MLLSKLNLKSRTLLLKHSGNSLEETDLDEIYAYLLLIYDTELTKHEALAKLSRNAGDYNTLSEFIEGISNLLDLSEIPDHARTIHFLDALRQTIDDTLYDKIIDWTQEYEITYGTSVPLTCLLDLLHRYKGSLNIAFAKKKQKVRVFNTMTKTEHGPQKERSGQISCGKCNSHSHLTDKCILCYTCNEFGHIARNCRKSMSNERNNSSARPKPCRLCGYSNHNSPNCRNYPNQIPVMGPCKYCMDSKGVKLYHAMNTCKSQMTQDRKINMIKRYSKN